MGEEKRLRVRDHVFAQVAGFALEGESHGLSVLPGQTGSGKTYAAAAVACAVALRDPAVLQDGKIRIEDGGGLPQRLIYVTPLRKNRDAFVGEISKFAAANGLDREAVLEKVYLVEGVADSAVAHAADESIAWPQDNEALKRALNELSAVTRSFRHVEQDIAKGAYENKESATIARNSAEEMVRAAERRLRSAAKSYCARRWEDETDDEGASAPTLAEFCAGPEYDWVRSAWPSSGTWGKRVFVMTPEKFMMSHDTILSGTFTWMTSRQPGQILDGAMVVIDESDTTYGRMLDKLIESAAKGAVDPVEYIQKLAHVSSDGFEGRDADVVGRDGKGKSYGLSRFSVACEQATALYEEYGLASNFKLSDEAGAKGAQLFSDGVSSSVRVNGEFKSLAVRHDKRSGKNWIVAPRRGAAPLPKIEANLYCGEDSFINDALFALQAEREGAWCCVVPSLGCAVGTETPLTTMPDIDAMREYLRKAAAGEDVPTERSTDTLMALYGDTFDIAWAEEAGGASALYYASDCHNANVKRARATRLRRLRTLDGTSVAPWMELLMPMLDVWFVKMRESTVRPFPLKYLNEWLRAQGQDL